MLPPHLARDTATGIAAYQPVAQFEIGDFRNFIYLILDWPSREAAIVDPQKDLEPPLAAMRAHGFRLTRVLLTHTHGDHTAGVPELARTFPDIPIGVHTADLHRLPSSLRSSPRIEKLTDGHLIRMGKLEIEALHTPGHSAGECCFLLRNTTPGYLFTGDTMFVRDCGRTDLETGSNEEMFASLQRIKRLDPSTIILPGHHYAREIASTLEQELRESAPLRCSSVQELAALP